MLCVLSNTKMKDLKQSQWSERDYAILAVSYLTKNYPELTQIFKHKYRDVLATLKDLFNQDRNSWDSSRIHELELEAVTGVKEPTKLTYFIPKKHRNSEFYNSLEQKLEFAYLKSINIPLHNSVYQKHITNLKKGLSDCIKLAKGKEAEFLERQLISMEGDYQSDDTIKEVLNVDNKTYQTIKRNALNLLADHPFYNELTWFCDIFKQLD